MPPELITFLIGASPIGEDRLAIPWGMTFGDLSIAEAFFWGVLGNICAVILVLLLLKPLTNFAQKHSPLLDRLLKKIFEKTRHKHGANFYRFGAIFLIFFIAVPLPGSGGYTGALVAWLFNVPRKIAIPLVSFGTVLAGLIVLGITTGALTLAELF